MEKESHDFKLIKIKKLHFKIILSKFVNDKLINM